MRRVLPRSVGCPAAVEEKDLSPGVKAAVMFECGLSLSFFFNFFFF